LPFWVKATGPQEKVGYEEWLPFAEVQQATVEERATVKRPKLKSFHMQMQKGSAS